MKLKPAVATLDTLKRLVYNIDQKYATKTEVSKVSEEVSKINEATTDEVDTILKTTPQMALKFNKKEVTK